MSDTPVPAPAGAEIILYHTEDGAAEVRMTAIEGAVWLTQAQMAELFQTSIQNISFHLKEVYADGELDEGATIKSYLIVRTEGTRQVSRPVLHYRLEAVLAVGYRVRSARGTQFRQWATRHLSEYLVKGFVMDDARLKDPKGWDYFDELLARIREIRTSEKRFYQKVRDLFTLSEDYRSDDHDAQIFFAEVQNKLLYAVTRHTAAELVVKRADPNAPNMALTSWKGTRVRKTDILTAKNYLQQDEIDTLNRLVVIFLEQAELRVKDRRTLNLGYWRDNVDRLLAFNERPVLDGLGSMSHEAMKTIVEGRYEQFDAQRKAAEARQADAEDLKALEEASKKLEGGKPSPPEPKKP